MKFQYYIYVVTDSHGNKDAAVSASSCDIVQICGMKNKNGESIFFEDDAHHLSCWAAMYGLTYEEKEISIDL